MLPLRAIFAVLLVSCSSTLKQAEPEVKKPEVELCTANRSQPARDFGGLNTFDRKMFAVLATEPTQNLIFSPASLGIALGMLQTGTRGESQRQLASALGYPGKSTGEVNAHFAAALESLSAITTVTVSVANSVWVDAGFSIEPDYITTLNSVYLSEAFSVDLQAPQTVGAVNTWASDHTNGLIPSMFDEPFADVLRLLLLNAVYFHGDWATPFKKEQTRTQSFYRAEGEPVNPAFMNQRLGARYIKTESFEALELPYKGGDIAMYVYLPDTNVGWSAFSTAFTGDTWGQCSTFNGLVALALPKFSTNSDLDLESAMKSVGVNDIWVPGTADLSGINSGLTVHFIRQWAKIIVNEKGTEAAAVTAIGSGLTSMPPTQPFVADRPFVFTIVDRSTSTVLFFGVVADPTLK